MLDLALHSALSVKHGHSRSTDEAQAVRELAAQIGQDPKAVVLVFCSPRYDLERLGRELQRTFPGCVVGCTSSGQLGTQGFQLGGITAASLLGPGLRARSYLFQSLATPAMAVSAAADDIRERGLALAPDWRRFGFLLVDGLSMAEEGLAEALYTRIGDVPIVGGSAGDELAFEKTWVYHQGRFVNGAASFTLFETTLPFKAFKFQHFVPSERKLIITAADPERRLVTEIDGLPAAEAYAAAIGVAPSELGPRQFSAHPLLLHLGEDHYIRSIQKMLPDQSLTFYCAIEEGMVLSIGRGIDALSTANDAFSALRREFEPRVVLGCDCILRRIEMEDKGYDAAMGHLLAENQVIGFSTYGEQFNAMHVNQTFTGIALGESHGR